jgi:hypothetical protein
LASPGISVLEAPWSAFRAEAAVVATTWSWPNERSWNDPCHFPTACVLRGKGAERCRFWCPGKGRFETSRQGWLVGISWSGIYGCENG